MLQVRGGNNFNAISKNGKWLPVLPPIRVRIAAWPPAPPTSECLESRAGHHWLKLGCSGCNHIQMITGNERVVTEKPS
jgi:hypothetical protein